MWRGMWRGTWRGLSRIVYNGHKKYHHIQKIINFALVFYKPKSVIRKFRFLFVYE